MRDTLLCVCVCVCVLLNRVTDFHEAWCEHCDIAEPPAPAIAYTVAVGALMRPERPQ